MIAVLLIFMLLLVSLVATGTLNIEGFIIQGRLSEDGGTTNVGEFSEPDTGRHHSCTPDKVLHENYINQYVIITITRLYSTLLVLRDTQN